MELFGSALLTDIAIRSLRCSLVALIEFVAAKIAAWHSGAGRTLAGIFPAVAAANRKRSRCRGSPLSSTE
jgi:hypothetical protein